MMQRCKHAGTATAIHSVSFSTCVPYYPLVKDTLYTQSPFQGTICGIPQEINPDIATALKSTLKLVQCSRLFSEWRYRFKSHFWVDPIVIKQKVKTQKEHKPKSSDKKTHQKNLNQLCICGLRCHSRIIIIFRTWFFWTLMELWVGSNASLVS